ncbi:MAG TPA: hypothetical protein PKM36_02255 [Propionibacteriaceae bacterium]|nr:hypothetical protein [Propionibacteriaceae bacterium]
MGWLDKLLGRDRDDDTPVADKVLGSDARRAQLVELSGALRELVTEMNGEACPSDNPGWRGRVRDYQYSLGGIDSMLATRITKDDLFDTLSTIRPLGAVPAGCEHLTVIAERVVVLARQAEKPLPGE